LALSVGALFVSVVPPVEAAGFASLFASAGFGDSEDLRSASAALL